MSIYRGAGGSGDAVNDASSEATLVQTLVTSATTQAANAATSATAAQAASTQAVISQGLAQDAATAAATAETNAETAETNAETAETNAASSASAASSSASTATTQAGIATTQATNASNSASAASTSATNASNSASAASTSATNASNSASAAATSATNAAASYDAFDDRYLGSKSSNPTVDNDGNALLTGALYFNTTVPEMRLYNGTNWIFIGSGAAAGVESFNTRTGAITLTSSDVTTALTYTPLAPAAIGTTVQAYDADLTTLGAGGSGARSFLGLAIGTDVQAYDAQLADIAGLTPTDNSFIVGNGTNFVAEGASTARTSLGVTATGADTTYAYRANNLSDLASASTARTNLGLGTAATTAATDYATATQGTKADNALTAANPSYTGTLTGGTGVVNLGSGQVYKDTSGNVGIGNLTPGNFVAAGRQLVVGSGVGNQGITIYSSTTDYGGLHFADGTTGTDSYRGIVYYQHSTDNMQFWTAATEKMRITSAGDVGIGTDSPATKLGVTGAISFTGNISAPAVDASVYRPADGTLGFVSNASESMRLTSNSLLQFNSGYGSVATAYGCRAWVNFDGSANTNLTGTYSQLLTTVTVTITAHGYITGSSAYLDFTSGTAVDGEYTVTVTDANTFTVTQASRTTSGNVTSRRNTIRGSGNVSSVTDVGTGTYTVNLTTAMPDANFASVSSNSRSTSASTPLSSSTIQVVSRSSSDAVSDNSQISVAVFR